MKNPLGGIDTYDWWNCPDLKNSQWWLMIHENWHYCRRMIFLHGEWIFWEGSVKFSTLFWDTLHCRGWPRASVHDSGSWKPGEASQGSGDQSGENQDQQRDKLPHDHWGLSWQLGSDPKIIFITHKNNIFLLSQVAKYRNNHMNVTNNF